MLGDFKRMIVGLPPTAGDYSLVEVTAKLAELLRLELVAMFAEDRSLMHAAGLPCVRELRPLGGGWQAIDARRFDTEWKASEAAARRLFARIADRCNIETSFRLEQGSPSTLIASVATASDIVAILEPRNPAARVTQQFTGLVDAAFRAASSVLIVPSRIARTSGPIVAVASTHDDPSLKTAVSIASAAKEKVLVIGPKPIASSLGQLMRDTPSMRAEFLTATTEPFDLQSLAGNLRTRQEQLIVTSRGTVPDSAIQALASLRSVPIMIIEPGKTAV